MLHRRPKVLGCIGCEMAEKEIAGLHAQILALETKIDKLTDTLKSIAYDLSDVGTIFDGHDELNEYTHEENAAHMEGYLDRINEVALNALASKDDEKTERK